MDLAHFKATYKHKKMFLKIEKELTGKNTLSGYFHDTDKLFMYLIPFITSKDVKKVHRKISKHHIPNCLTSKKWMIQAIIDWESCRFTKPDKPETAREYIEDFIPQYADIFIPILNELGLKK